MRYFWISIILFGLLFFLCCNSYKGNKIKNVLVTNSCNPYPSYIDSLNFKGLFDSAKFDIYLWHCDIPYCPKDDSTKQMQFGELELRFDTIVAKNDTVEFSFYFIDNTEKVLSTSTKKLQELITGIGYNIKSHKKIYAKSPNGFLFSTNEKSSRYNNYYENEAVKYIKENWAKVNPCFKLLSEKRGIKP